MAKNFFFIFFYFHRDFIFKYLKFTYLSDKKLMANVMLLRELNVFVNVNVRKGREKDKMYIHASSNEIAAKSNRAIYYSFDRKRRDCKIAYVFPRTNVGDRREGWCRGLRERGVARCIQKCIWLPGKRSMEQHGNALCDLGEEHSYRFLINSRRFAIRDKFCRDDIKVILCRFIIV